jgi:spermidine synthase
MFSFSGHQTMSYRLFLYLLFFLSGVAGLGYEILWTRMLSVSLGHEIISMLAVVSAFFSGLAIGAWGFDRAVSRSSNPAGWYAAFELAIGLWALVLVFLLPAISPLVSKLIGVSPAPAWHWTVAFVYPFLMLLPATAAMGGTLPAMDRFFARLKNGQRVAGLYSVNTLGAMTGTLLVTFWLLPAFGTTSSSVLLALLNIFGALSVLWIRQYAAEKGRAMPVSQQLSPVSSRLYLILFTTGLLGIGFEVIMVRVLSQIFENTIFSFANLLITYLLGTACGAALYQRWQRKLAFESGLRVLLTGTTFSCLTSIYLLRFAPDFFSSLQAIFGKGFSAAIGAELLCALALFLLPTLFMGATFSHLAQHLRRKNGGVGRALCLNTLGGALAPPLFGISLIPLLGLKILLLVVAVAYLLLMPQLFRKGLPLSGTAVAGVIFLFFAPFDYRFVDMPEGDSIVSHQEGVMASVTVLKDQKNGYHLKVNNRFQMGGTSSVYTDLRQAQLPLLLHEKPQSALFLGLGTGMTFAGAANYPDLQAQGVELIPEVIAAIPYFKTAHQEISGADNLEIIAADARRYVLVSEKKYDVVIADLFHPARDGAGYLYTVEHFTAVKNRLNQNGLFCQWLPLYQLDTETLKIIIKSFLEAFPESQAYLAHYSVKQPIIGLVGSLEPHRYPERWFRNKMRDKTIREKVLPLKYDSFYSLFGTFLAGKKQLETFTADSPLNTDQHPVVLFKAPHFVYGEPEPPQDRLLALLAELSPADPKNVLAEYVTEEDYWAPERLSAYWQARNSFLRVGAEIQKTGDVTKLYQTASQPLLKVVRESQDFTAAYFPLLTIAYEMYPIDQQASRQLLGDLVHANPARREAYILKEKLFHSGNEGQSSETF